MGSLPCPPNYPCGKSQTIPQVSSILAPQDNSARLAFQVQSPGATSHSGESPVMTNLNISVHSEDGKLLFDYALESVRDRNHEFKIYKPTISKVDDLLKKFVGKKLIMKLKEKSGESYEYKFILDA